MHTFEIIRSLTRSSPRTSPRKRPESSRNSDLSSDTSPTPSKPVDIPGKAPSMDYVGDPVHIATPPRRCPPINGGLNAERKPKEDQILAGIEKGEKESGHNRTDSALVPISPFDPFVLNSLPEYAQRKLLKNVDPNEVYRVIFLKPASDSLRAVAEDILRKLVAKSQLLVFFSAVTAPWYSPNMSVMTLEFSSVSCEDNNVVTFTDINPIPQYRRTSGGRREKIWDFWAVFEEFVNNRNEKVRLEGVTVNFAPLQRVAGAEVKRIDKDGPITIHKSVLHSTVRTVLSVNLEDRSIQFAWKALFPALVTKKEMDAAFKSRFTEFAQTCKGRALVLKKPEVNSVYIGTFGDIFYYSLKNKEGKKLKAEAEKVHQEKKLEGIKFSWGEKEF
ncbi:hypothetical protein GQ43DRAFT_435747 [Delitschia confertaspora ATCC 74209]|uniref:Uncharacterized protein n=1 Tax=Delitschia confertaspora ATCC 74209 TaxID=1513339 RepID=A0A9P4MN90_9PLEO|nr:hypothetical protein GQ43DRAFT_435747 [Delitschia confertaspora ATCC 74209]